MEQIVDLLKDADDALPIRHQFGKLVVGVIAGFGAKKLGEKAYVAVLECYKIRKAAITQ